MRWTALLAALLVLGSAAPGQAQQYRERWNELSVTLSWGLDGINELVLPRIEDQFEKRDATFANVRKNHLQNGSTSNLEQQAKWVEDLQNAAEAQNKAFTDIAALAIQLIERAAQPPADLPMEYLAQLREEVPQRILSVGSHMVASHQKVKAMPLASLRDSLIGYRKAYEEEMKRLGDKMRTLESSDSSIDSTTKGYRRALMDACSALRRAKTEAERDLQGVISEIKKGSTADDARGFRDRLLRRIDYLVRDLNAFERGVRDNAGRLQGSFSQEWAVIKMFIEARKAVAAFEAKINLEMASQQFRAGGEKAKADAGTMTHTNDQKDLLAFVALASGDVQQHLNGYKGDYEKFKTAFQGKLLGTVDSSTSERFAEFAEWEDWADDVLACAPVDILDNLERSEMDRWGANTDVVQDETARRAFLGAIDEARAKLNRATAPAQTQARRLQDLAQLEDREAMLEALEDS